MASSSQIAFYYQAIFGRAPTQSEASFWNAVQADGQIDNSQIILSLASSAEASGNASTILRMYEAVFGHKPDQAGFQFWEQQLAAGKTVDDLANSFVTSNEFKAFYGVGTSFDLTAFVSKLYTNVLGRAPDDAGLSAWVHSGLTPAKLVTAFAQSTEYTDRAAPEVLQFLMQAAAGTEDYQGSIFTDIPLASGKSDGVTDIGTLVQNLFAGILQRSPTDAELSFYKAELGSGAFSLSQIAAALSTSAEADGNPSTIIRIYEATFGHKPDKAGFTTWVDALAAGQSVGQIITGFVNSQEFKDHYGSGSTFDATAFVKAVYQNALGRQPDATGLDYWLHSGQSPAAILQQFAQSPEFILRADPKILTFFENIAAGKEGYQGSIFDTQLPGTTGQSDTPTPPTDAGGGGGGDTTPPTIKITTEAGLTNSLKQTIFGTVGLEDAGTTVHIFDGKNEIGTALVGADGKWSASVSLLNAQGAHSVLATDTDSSGNTGSSNQITFTLDTTPPAAPTATLATDSGSSASDKITNVGTVNIAGLEAGATWEYSLDAGAHWTAGSGTSVTLAGDGAKSLTVRETDVAGNVSASSPALAFTLDTTVAAPTATLATDSGSSASDKITNVGTVNIAGLEAGATWEYSLDAGAHWTAGSGTSVTLAGDGAKSLTVRETDVAGNVSASSPALAFTFDTMPPAAPTATLATDSGSSASDKITNVGTVNIAGLEAGATWEYSLDAGAHWTAGSGTSVTLAGDGAKSLTVRETDVAGNVSASSPALAFTLDTTVAAPTATLATDSGSSASDKITNVGTVNIAGLEAGATWEYSLDAGAHWTAGSGTSVTLAGDGAKSLTVRETDVAGNVSASSPALAFTLDTTVAAPTATLATDSGSSASDKITNVGTVNIAGLEAGATWEYSLDAGAHWTAGSGTSVTLAGDGAKSLTVRETDVAGNVSASSPALAFTLDTTVAAPTATLATDSGSSASDKITNVGTVNIAGLEAGATWEYSLDAGAHWTAGSGTSVTLAGDGAKSLTVRETDVAGNVSAASSPALAFTLDKTAPTVVINQAKANGQSSNANITFTTSDAASGIDHVLVWQDNSSSTTTYSGGQQVYTIHNFDNVSTLHVEAFDIAGNSYTLNWSVAIP